MVSIVLPSFNKEQFVAATLRSVFQQTYSQWELIIIDDCSTDNTVNVIRDVSENDPRVSLHTNKINRGGNYCRNLGIRHAKGPYVIFLDADDLLAPDCLRNRVAAMEADPNLDFCVFTMGNFYTTVGDSKLKWAAASKFPLKDFLRHRLPWQIMQPIWKKNVLVKVGGFDESFPRFQDVEFYTRILFPEEFRFKQVNATPDCYYRIGDDRRNYNTFEYNRLRVKACSLYYNKFYALAKARGLAKYMLGCIYETYLQTIVHTRTGKMSMEEFRILEEALLNDPTIISLRKSKRTLFKISRWYHFNLPRIPGINKVLTTLILS